MEKPYKSGRAFLFRLPQGSDPGEAINDFCIRKRIRAGTVTAIGALSKATLGYYDQKKRRYFKKTLRRKLEIVSCMGNVSIKDGKPFAHLHAALGDAKLRVHGGHLFPGSRVFAAEVCVTELKGPARIRRLDPGTGLPLWPRPKR